MDSSQGAATQNAQTKISGLQADPRKLLALHPEDARKVLIGPEAFKAQLDREFIDNVRKLSMLYEALQTGVKAAQGRESDGSLSIDEVQRHLAIHKRSINDRTRTPAGGELLAQLLLLAGQPLAFICILRPLVLENKKISFRTYLMAPTDSQPDQVSASYARVIEKINSSLRSIKSNSFENSYIETLRSSLNSSSPEPRIGRIDYELRKMYIQETDTTAPNRPNIRKCIARVNQDIFDRLYRPAVLAGIKDKTLVSFSCEDVRSASGENKNSKQFYDIIHFASPSYLKERFKILCKFCTPSFFQDWWSEEQAAKLKQSLDSNEITESQYYTSLSQTILTKLQTNINTVASALVSLAIEIVKLSQWLNAYEINRNKEEKQNQFNNIIAQIKAANNLYQVRDTKWLAENKEIVHAILCGKMQGILGATHPYYNPFQIGKDFDLKALHANIYLIIKDKKITGNAIQSAVKVYKQVNDVTLLRVLENIFQLHTTKNTELREYIAPVYLNILWEAVNHSYTHHLSWFSRLYHALLSKQLSSSKLKRIRAKIETTQRRSSMERLTKVAKASSLQKKREMQKNYENSAMQKDVQDQAITEEEKQLIKKLCEYMNQQWANHHYPQREDLMKVAGNQGHVMKKMLSLVDIDTLSVRPIITIHVHGMEQIYASRDYLKNHRDTLIRQFTEKAKKEETYTIDDKTYISIDSQKKFLYKAILDTLKKITLI